MAWWIDADAAVNGDGSQASPFNAWQAFLAGAAGDLTGLGEVDVFIKGVLDDPNFNGFQFNLDGFTNENASDFLHFKPWPGFEGTGLPGDATPGWRSGTTGSGSQYVALGSRHRASYLQLQITNTGSMDCFSFNNAIYTGMLVYAPTVSLRWPFTFHTSTVQDCIVLCNEADLAFRESASNTTVVDVRNCSAIRLTPGEGDAFGMSGANATIRNCVAYGGWTNEYAAANASSSNNAGELAAASQPVNIQNNYVQITTDPFADSANGDYSPAGGSVLDGAGVTISGLTEDAAGNAWADPPSIGALEVAVGGDTTAPTYSVAPVQQSVTYNSATTTATASDETELTVDHYSVVVANGAAAPSAAQIAAGQDATGAAAIHAASSLDVDNGVAAPIQHTGLAPSTAYDIYRTVSDGTNFATPQKVDITTSASPLRLRLNAQGGDNLLEDTDEGTLVNQLNAEVVVFAGAAGARTIVYQGVADITNGVLEDIADAAFDTVDVTFEVAIIISSTVRVIAPATVVDTSL